MFGEKPVVGEFRLKQYVVSDAVKLSPAMTNNESLPFRFECVASLSTNTRINKVHFVCQTFAWSRNAIRNSGLPPCNILQLTSGNLSQSCESCDVLWSICSERSQILHLGGLEKIIIPHPSDLLNNPIHIGNRITLEHGPAITSEHILIAASTAHSTLITIGY